MIPGQPSFFCADTRHQVRVYKRTYPLAPLYLLQDDGRNQTFRLVGVTSVTSNISGGSGSTLQNINNKKQSTKIIYTYIPTFVN